MIEVTVNEDGLFVIANPDEVPGATLIMTAHVQRSR